MTRLVRDISPRIKVKNDSLIQFLNVLISKFFKSYMYQNVNYSNNLKFRFLILCVRQTTN